MPMNAIRTSRLVLIPQTALHARELFAVLSDPLMYEFEPVPTAPYEAFEERLGRLESRASPDGSEIWLNWVVADPASGTLMGFVQATVTPGGSAYIAYMFNSRYWGRGFAREAVAAMIGEVIEKWRPLELRAVFKTANSRSRRLLAALGFEMLADDESAGPDETAMGLQVPTPR